MWMMSGPEPDWMAAVTRGWRSLALMNSKTSSALMPWTALAYMSVMMYFVNVSVAFAVDGPACPNRRVLRAAVRNILSGSSSLPHIGLFSQALVAPTL